LYYNEGINQKKKAKIKPKFWSSKKDENEIKTRGIVLKKKVVTVY